MSTTDYNELAIFISGELVYTKHSPTSHRKPSMYVILFDELAESNIQTKLNVDDSVWYRMLCNVNHEYSRVQMYSMRRIRIFDFYARCPMD